MYNFIMGMLTINMYIMIGIFFIMMIYIIIFSIKEKIQDIKNKERIKIYKELGYKYKIEWIPGGFTIGYEKEIED